MNDRNIVRLADDAAELMTRIANTLGTVTASGSTVLTRMRDGFIGHPQAQRFNPPTRVALVPNPDQWPDGENPDRDNHLPSDPTGEAALRPDKAKQHRDEVVRLLRSMQTNAERVQNILACYSPRPATDADRAKLEQQNDPGCQSCSRVEVRPGVPRWEPVQGVPTDCAGNLTVAMALCSWCKGFIKDTGRLPHLAELGQHHDGKRVKRSA